MERPTPSPTLYLNIHTADPEKCVAFYTALGFTTIPAYSDAETKSFRLPPPNDTVCLMVHGPDRFKTFIRPGTERNDATQTTETLFSIAVDIKEAVDEWVATAVTAGGTADPYKMDDFGASCGMYTRSFADLGGHIWETVAMIGEYTGEKKD